MSSLVSRIGRAVLRFLLRRWASGLIVLFSLVAGLTLYQMWRAGPIAALSFLPQLAMCLAVIAAVAVIRQAIKGWGKGALAKGVGAASAQAAKGAMQEGLTQGREALEAGLKEAQGALSNLGDHVKEELDELVSGPGPTVTSVLAPRAPRCPACRRFVRVEARFCDNCGAPLPILCRRCGRALRERARFCDACGAVARDT